MIWQHQKLNKEFEHERKRKKKLV